MDHVETIKRLLKTLQVSEKMHALIVTGPAGFGKSTAVDEALHQLKARSVHLGAYSSPLNLFNFLHENSAKGTTVVIDDTSGIYNEPSAMAILKAATWAQGKPRVLRWGSTTGRATVEEFEFKGKIVIVCNNFPSSADASAVRSRAFPYIFEVNETKARELLLEAAKNRKWFSNTKLASTVANHLCGMITNSNLSEMSYRTLQMGYEIAEHNPDDWKVLLGQMISVDIEDPHKLIRRLAKEKISVREQVNRFERATGFKRRTFFKYRRELNLSSRGH
jgi:DNA polymerase III delta prime subunit